MILRYDHLSQDSEPYGQLLGMLGGQGEALTSCLWNSQIREGAT